MMRVVRMLAMACVVLTAAQASAQVTGTPTVPTAIVPMAKGGTGAALADPNADRLLFWDDSAGSMAWLTMGTNLSISGTTLNASGTGGGGLGAVDIDTSAKIAAIVTDESGNGSLVFDTGPTLSAPVIIGEISWSDIAGSTNGTLDVEGGSWIFTYDGSTMITMTDGSFSYNDGVRQTFNPNATTPGINVGSQAGDPSTPSNGDLWYDSTANELTARINGANVALGAGGGGGAPTDATYITQTAHGSLSAEFAMGSLATGIVKNTTTTGVPSIAVAGTDYVAPGGALGTPSSGTLTNCSGLPIAGLTASTGTAIGVGSIELGHATDTTLARASAGNVTIEGNALYRAGGTDVALADGGTGASLSDPNADRVLFWDDSAGAMTWLTMGANLTITGTTLDAGSGGSVASIDDVGDVTLTTPADGEFMEFDGAEWVNTPFAGDPTTNAIFDAGNWAEAIGLNAFADNPTANAEFSAGNWRTGLALVIGTNVQAWNAALDSWAAITRASGFDTFTATPSLSNFGSLVTGEGTGVITALGINVGSAGAFVTNGGALGTPSSGTLTNCTIPVAGIIASTSTALGVGSIELGHATATTLTGSGGVLSVEGSNVLVASGLGSVTQAYDADLADLADGTLTGTKVDQASDTVRGTLETATAAETTTGTSVNLAVSPDSLAGSAVFGVKAVEMVVFDFATDTATGNGKFYFTVPSNLNGMNLVAVHAYAVTAGTTSTTDVMIARLRGTVDMLSAACQIASTKNGSDETGGSAGTINTSNDDVVTNDVIRVDVDNVSGTPAKGLIVRLEFQLP